MRPPRRCQRLSTPQTGPSRLQRPRQHRNREGRPDSTVPSPRRMQPAGACSKGARPANRPAACSELTAGCPRTPESSPDSNRPDAGGKLAPRAGQLVEPARRPVSRPRRLHPRRHVLPGLEPLHDRVNRPRPQPGQLAQLVPPQRIVRISMRQGVEDQPDRRGHADSRCSHAARVGQERPLCRVRHMIHCVAAGLLSGSPRTALTRRSAAPPAQTQHTKTRNPAAADPARS